MSLETVRERAPRRGEDSFHRSYPRGSFLARSNGTLLRGHAHADATVGHHAVERRGRRDGRRIRSGRTDASSGFAAPPGCDAEPGA